GREGERLCRSPQCGDRVSLGRQSNRSAAGIGGRPGPPPGRADRGGERERGVRRQGRPQHDPGRIRHRRGPGPPGPGLQPGGAGGAGSWTAINCRSAERVAKRLELLRELIPGATRVAGLVNPSNPSRTESTVRDAEAAGRAMGMQIQVGHASTSRHIDAVFAAFTRERPDALLVGDDPLFTSRRVQLTQLAAFHRLPATYASREIAEAGGLMSYGASLTDAYQQFGAYVGRLLKGAKPADLPVVQSSKFELV